MKKSVVLFSIVICASISFAQLTEPSGLTVFKDWNFDGDGIVGGSVDSGASATDWVNNSPESIRDDGGFDINSTLTNLNMFVDTTGIGTFNFSNASTDPDRPDMTLTFGDGHSSLKGFMNFRAANERITTQGKSELWISFENAAGSALFTLSWVENDQFFLKNGQGYPSKPTLCSVIDPSVALTNGYQVSWDNGVVGFHFDGEAGGPSLTTNVTVSAGTDVAQIRFYFNNWDKRSRFVCDEMTIKYLPDPFYPEGLAVFKDWQFDGDGAVGGTVDSGETGTDWVNNSWASVRDDGGFIVQSGQADEQVFVDTLTDDGVLNLIRTNGVAASVMVDLGGDQPVGHFAADVKTGASDGAFWVEGLDSDETQLFGVKVHLSNIYDLHIGGSGTRTARLKPGLEVTTMTTVAFGWHSTNGTLGVRVSQDGRNPAETVVSNLTNPVRFVRIRKDGDTPGVVGSLKILFPPPPPPKGTVIMVL